MRECSVCGDRVYAGMTNIDNSFYCHEGCFERFMDDAFGKHRWMCLGNNEEDELGGYYITTADVACGFEGTGIYYTEWEEDDEDE